MFGSYAIFKLTPFFFNQTSSYSKKELIYRAVKFIILAKSVAVNGRQFTLIRIFLLVLCKKVMGLRFVLRWSRVNRKRKLI